MSFPFTPTHNLKRAKHMIKFLYFRNEKKTPIACIAYELQPKPSKEIKFQYSCCALEDKWGDPIDTPNKALGRTIAEGRLAKRPMSFTFKDHPIREMLDLVNNSSTKFPLRMKTIAEEMINERLLKQIAAAE